ncbi:MAG TPA: hypothetical protein VKA84_16875 [Gemmatimonadaceae bacterium]|nr:hypothetical protein [Gemmatimonadaceae bacterium]
MIDPLELLARDDKWQLGCGDAIIFAPPFPLWLDAPGFWDEATVFQYAFGPLFTVSVLEDDGTELPLRPTSRRWTPAELTVEYALGDGGGATEVLSVQPGGIFASEWSVRQPRTRRRLHLVAWTAQPGPDVDASSVVWKGALAFARTVRDRRDVPMRVSAELACRGEATSWAASLSERTASQPHWRLAPFRERWRGAALPRDVRMEGLDQEGLLFAALHHAIPAAGEEGHASATFAMRLTPELPPAPSTAPSSRISGRSVAAGAASLGVASRRRWKELFARAPAFRCSDPYLERYYWYRWYGLTLQAVEPGLGNYAHPSVCEGPDFFHQPIAYSAPCHARELRWLDDPSLARGVLRTFFAHQKPDGSFHGRIYANHLAGTDFYHADWGGAVLALDDIAPDDTFAGEAYRALSRYAEWLLGTRDADRTGMVDVVDQYETGQEYMSRYQAVDPSADRYGWENRIRLKGVDVTVYAYSLLRCLERLAPRAAGSPGAAARWRALAERASDALRTRMWDAEEGMFSDVDPRTGRRTGVKAAVCFYPYMTDVVSAEHLDGLEQNLFDPARFWTPFPVPSSSADDPLFSAHGEWKGKRHACPWNGRVWPMTNSHLVEALAAVARRPGPHLREAAAGLLRRFVHMMFDQGDVRRPTSFEHYNPLTGHGSAYRGVDDYQHSWVNDLILQYVVGVRPRGGGVTVDPLPFGLELAQATGVRVRGATLDVTVAGDRVRVAVDDAPAREAPLGTAIEVEL